MGLQPGAEFAGFTVERVVGSGGMGTVYLARQPRLQRLVALKVLAESFSAAPKTRAAFDREAALAAGLDHPNIVPVYDRSAVDDPELWLTMRYIDGGDAAALLDATPDGLAPDRVVRLITDAAGALDHAHARGVLHRDVKPANLLIENNQRLGERAMLTDFGIARTLDDTVTLSGIAASFAYAAPERFTNAPSDHSADIYSLGCTLFQLLTGQPPFPRKDQAAVVGAHLTEPPPAPSELRPELPAELDAVIATALAKAPRERYPSCLALAEAAAYALTTPASATRPRARRRTSVPGGPRQFETVTASSIGDTVWPVHISPGLHVTPRGSRRRRRVAIGAGMLLAAAGLAVGLTFALRSESESAHTPTSVAVAPQRTSSSAVPIRSTSQPAAPPTGTPSTDIPLSIAAQPSEQQTAEQPQPAIPAPARGLTSSQPPPVVPQTRSFQWSG
ncbi:protein kinase [Nocardia sp. NEAU-G5]|uniref:non-specific serine/threonine protein kinase n=1 Tax=Nocardia albiluteola TaxID=2842303 RepID=A0ABS6AVS6_9NOCA|nr:serine/threonine-protein kinase [Nocardia albiluteola]MBU3061124.1 protein kinase [Nocardia albiluteola]